MSTALIAKPDPTTWGWVIATKEYLQSLSYNELIGFLLAELRYTDKFHHYCNLIVQYWDRIHKRSLFTALFGGVAVKNGDRELAALVQAIRDHKLARKSG